MTTELRVRNEKRFLVAGAFRHLSRHETIFRTDLEYVRGWGYYYGVLVLNERVSSYK